MSSSVCHDFLKSVTFQGKIPASMTAVVNFLIGVYGAETSLSVLKITELPSSQVWGDLPKSVGSAPCLKKGQLCSQSLVSIKSLLYYKKTKSGLLCLPEEASKWKQHFKGNSGEKPEVATLSFLLPVYLLIQSLLYTLKYKDSTTPKPLILSLQHRHLLHEKFHNLLFAHAPALRSCFLPPVLSNPNPVSLPAHSWFPSLSLRPNTQLLPFLPQGTATSLQCLN